jgi:hypothetical protein
MRPPCALQDEKTATQNRQVISCTFLRKTIGFLNQYPERAIFDEAQQVPQLFSYIQGRMDERRLMGQYILSESQNFHLAQHITQSLAGRVALFRLLPFDFWEMRQAHALPDTIPRTDTALTGFYPAIFDRGSDPSFFYHNCLQTHYRARHKPIGTGERPQSIPKFFVIVHRSGRATAQLLELGQREGRFSAYCKGMAFYFGKQLHRFPIAPLFSKLQQTNPKLNFYDTASGGNARHKTLIYGGLEHQDRTSYRLRGWKWCGVE